MKQLFDRKFLKFIIVGVFNTVLGYGIMLLLRNCIGLDYWISSATNYILTSILSFFLNKNFTFQNKDKYWKTALKFFVNIAVCYLIAFYVAKPAAIYLLSGHQISETFLDDIAMAVGMVIFTGLNYLGQRFFAFREPKKSHS